MMARKNPPSAPAGAAVPTEAMRGALAVVAECMRAEARAQWLTAQDAPAERSARVRLSLALGAIATRIESESEKLA